MRELALAFVGGKVITSLAVPADLWRMVFMPLALMRRRDLRGVVMVYARTDADPMVPSRAINGWPMFAACRLMRKRDYQRFCRYVEEARTLVTDFVKP